MWGNLTGRLKDVAAVVAPPADSDEEEYETDDEEYEEYTDEEEESEDGRSPFGLVNMLAKALDQEQQEHEESHQSHEVDDEEEEFIMHHPKDPAPLQAEGTSSMLFMTKSAEEEMAPPPPAAPIASQQAENEPTPKQTTGQQAPPERGLHKMETPPKHTWSQLRQPSNENSKMTPERQKLLNEALANAITPKRATGRHFTAESIEELQASAQKAPPELPVTNRKRTQQSKPKRAKTKEEEALEKAMRRGMMNAAEIEYKAQQQEAEQRHALEIQAAASLSSLSEPDEDRQPPPKASTPKQVNANGQASAHDSARKSIPVKEPAKTLVFPSKSSSPMRVQTQTPSKKGSQVGEEKPSSATSKVVDKSPNRPKAPVQQPKPSPARSAKPAEPQQPIAPKQPRPSKPQEPSPSPSKALQDKRPRQPTSQPLGGQSPTQPRPVAQKQSSAPNPKPATKTESSSAPRSPNGSNKPGSNKPSHPKPAGGTVTAASTTSMLPAKQEQTGPPAKVPELSSEEKGEKVVTGVGQQQRDSLPREQPISPKKSKKEVSAAEGPPAPMPRDQSCASSASQEGRGAEEHSAGATAAMIEKDAASKSSVQEQSDNAPTDQTTASTEPVVKSLLEAASAAPSVDRDLHKQLEERCLSLEEKLEQAEKHVLELQQEALRRMEEEEKQRQAMLINFQEKEARLLEASAEDYQQEIYVLRQEMETRTSDLEQQLQHERNSAALQQERFRTLLDEADARTEQAQNEAQKALAKQSNSLMHEQQRLQRSAKMTEDKLAQTLAMLDERDEEVSNLRHQILSLNSKMDEHQEGAQEAEEEMVELHNENEELRQHVHALEVECNQLRARAVALEADSERLSSLQMEMHMLTEARERERAQSESATQSAVSNHAQVEAERDAALAEIRDLKHQLEAALADLEVARSDTNRIIAANNNLQNALEAFQGEREAELALLEEQRLETEEATAAAHAAAIQATHEAHEAEMRHVQNSADSAIKSMEAEVNHLKSKVEESRKENAQLRHTLDEAIHRLQTSQEDVIDRSLMKNILLDWHTMKQKEKKQQVLELMASVLHFTEEEKAKIHIHEGPGALEKVVGAVAAPLPPARADVEHLKGDNVREKWVNFLMAEADGED